MTKKSITQLISDQLVEHFCESIASIEERAWASVTFSGNRYTITLNNPRNLEELEYYDFVLPNDWVVADALVTYPNTVELLAVV